jgi:uncharacterized membrane protein
MSEVTDVNPGGGTRDLGPEIRLTHILYILHGLAPFTAWLLAICAIIIGFVKRDDVRGTFLDTHYSWLARTFWWGFLWAIICGVITFVLIITIIGALIAWVPFLVLFVWYLYRVIRGWLRLNDNLPID